MYHPIPSESHPLPPTPAGEDRTMELYGPDFTAVFTVPLDDIAQLPSKKLNVTRLVVCSNYNSAVTQSTPQPTSEAWRASACSAGHRCKFVHVSRPISDFPSHAIHVHYIWQSLEAVTYQRLWSGLCSHAPAVWLMNPPDCRAEVKRYDEQRQRSHTRLLTAGGNVEQHDKDEDERVAFAMMVDLIASVAPAMRVPATRLLKTTGATTYLHRRMSGIKPDYALAPCSHYMCHNECRLGEECPDAHVINIDASQSTPFVRRTLRHVKAASEATMVQNEGRAQNGLFGLVNERSKAKVVEVDSTAAQKADENNAGSATQGHTNSSNNISKHSGEQTSSVQQSSDEVAVRVAETDTSSSPMQFHASTLATPSTGNSGNGSGNESGGGSGGGSGDGGSGDGNSNFQSGDGSDDEVSTD